MSLIEKIALKPCPFCGGEAVLAHSHEEPFDLAACLKCLTQGPARPTQPEAIAAWNNRADLTAIMDAGDGVQECDRDAAKAMVFALLDQPDPDSVARTAMDYIARHRSTAAAAERARIVAWLRGQDNLGPRQPGELADAIERGDVL